MKRLFFAEFIIFASITTAHASTFFDSVFVGKNAYVAPCQIADGTYPDYEMAAQCNRWCNSRYASWVDDSTYNFVTVIDCDSVGVTPSYSRYSYCCVNNSVTGMINGCVCQGAHKTTILGSSNTMQVTEQGTDLWTVECGDYKCFCEDGYYGVTKKLSQSSTSDTCTECPPMPSNNYGYNNAQITAQTYNNVASCHDDSCAPDSSTITSCNISANCPVTPYCNRYDETGQWSFSSNCHYSL